MHPFLIYTLYFTLLVSTLTYTFYSVERLIEMKKAGLLIFKIINNKKIKKKPAWVLYCTSKASRQFFKQKNVKFMVMYSIQQDWVYFCWKTEQHLCIATYLLELH